MATNPREFVDAADDLLKKLERSKLMNEGELETVRKELVRDVKDEAKRAVKNMQTARVGSAKLLVPNAANLRKINLSTERIRQRMSSFRLSYLNRDQVAALTGDGKTLNDDPKKFIRHSRRLARHAREFLTRIGELEPDLQEEVDATLQQIEDNDMDLLKLEVKSFTRMKETMLRAVNGRKERGEVLREIDDWDLNRQLFNLSLLEHQDATVRSLLANAAEVMGSRETTKVSEIPKRSHVFVGLPPAKAAKMTPSSRTAEIAWRVMDTGSVAEKFKSLPPTEQSKSSWRGLGLGYNTGEWYVPVPPRIVSGLSTLAATRRASALAAAGSRAEAAREVAEAAVVSVRITPAVASEVWDLNETFRDEAGWDIDGGKLTGKRADVIQVAKNTLADADADTGLETISGSRKRAMRNWATRVLEELEGGE